MKKIIFIIALVVATVSCQTEKTGYVNTEELLTEFNELKDTRDRYTAENESIMSDLQLKMDAFEIKGKQFQANAASMNRADQEKRYNELVQENQMLEQERQKRMGQLQMESQRVIDSLITKVKDKVKAYGKENGYDYIYGSNDAGSVLYGKEELNLTEAILAEMNAAYTPKTKGQPVE